MENEQQKSNIDQPVVSSRHGELSRKEIEATINGNNEAIEKLEAENLELRKQALLLSDDEQQYREEMETHGRGKKKREMLVGRIHWKEEFKDEDTGQSIWIERSQVVRVNGVWQ